MGSFGKPRWLRMGFLGFPKSGKTYTSISVACGLHKLIGSKRPIQVFDTEGGFDYQAPRIERLTGMMPDGIQSHSFADLMRFVATVQKGDIVIIDSVTHPWRELLAAFQNRKGRFQGIMAAKEEWSTRFSAWYLSFPSHNIIAGRAGFEFDEQEDEHGEMKLVKTGTKMKTESELGFEPSLLVEMERRERRDGTLSRAAIVKGDRFGVIDGRTFDNPNFETFKPFFDNLDLVTATPPTVDTEPKTEATLDDNGRGAVARAREEREILLDEIKTDLMIRWPGQSTEEKKAKVSAIRGIFGVAWTALEKEWSKFPTAVLREGREKLQAMIAESMPASTPETTTTESE